MSFNKTTRKQDYLFRKFSRIRLFGNRSLKKDEKGVAAVEMALVTPFLLLLTVGIIDFGSLFFLKNNMHNVARQTARTLATDTSVDISMVKSQALSTLSGWSTTFNVQASLPDQSLGETNVVVSISVPMADVVPVGLIAFSGTMETRVAMRLEGI